MPDLHNNPSIFPSDDDGDVDVFEFDRKLKEISLKIDDTMQRINAHYPEKTDNEPAAENAG